ncbi:tyrosine-type recombinase/integrase [Clostridium cagae]|uniref:tyrosine-type recombinase/integrase n=1 Tax=Clostridium cagae TaxID=2080751 RepID=UPI00278C07E8|nr:tyrosine-type recombinase/integrase [Clostridium cagae]
MIQALNVFNKKRGIDTTGIHRLRHTFAKQWILSGNSIVELQKILGHSSLAITQHYVNIMLTDLEEDVNNSNILMKFSNQYISIF